MMFIYESLKDHEKGLILNEIKKAYIKLVLKNKGFNYTEKQFNTMVNELAIRNEVIDSLIGGNSLMYFNLKDTVIRSKALEIGYSIESNRPSLDLLKQYIKLCDTLQVSPLLDVLFDVDKLNELIYAYEYYIQHNKKNLKINENNLDKIVDFWNINHYTKNSLIIWFVELVIELYDLNEFEVCGNIQTIQNIVNPSERK